MGTSGAERRAARELVSAYHESCLTALVDQLADALEQYRVNALAVESTVVVAEAITAWGLRTDLAGNCKAMTGPQTITIEHLNALLDASDATSMIGLIEGKVVIIGAAQRDSEKYRGALEVISREQLVERLGGEAEEAELRALAAELTTTTALLGG